MDASAALQPASNGAATRLTVRAQPGARRSGFAGLWNGMPKIAVTAPPENGRANEEIAAELARLFQLRPAQVTHVSGATSRQKVFQLELPLARVAARLEEIEREAEELTARRAARRSAPNTPPNTRPTTPPRTRGDATTPRDTKKKPT